MRPRKNFWEKVFIYPSFNIRFVAVVGVIVFGFSFIAYKLSPIFSEIDSKLGFINLLVQLATLLFAIVAAYYALRQLIETRFEKLEEIGMNYLKRGRYIRAINIWKEAFYIKPDFSVFSNLMETFLLIDDFDEFDKAVKYVEVNHLLKQRIFHEDSETLGLLYLKAIRHLLVENLGEAKKQILEIVNICTKDSRILVQFGWDFEDLKKSDGYKKLRGDAKSITDNLIAYLSGALNEEKKTKFQNGNYILS